MRRGNSLAQNRQGAVSGDRAALPCVASLTRLAPRGAALCEMPRTYYLTEPSQLGAAGARYPLSTERARLHL